MINFILGVLTMALISFYFYRKQKKDQKKDRRQLIEAFRAEILSSSQRSFSISKLNEMIDDLVVDKDLVEKKDPLPYKKCPKCGSSALKRESDIDVDVDGDNIIPNYFWETISCENCDWEKTADTDMKGRFISYHRR